jgi:hypothetical protein
LRRQETGNVSQERLLHVGHFLTSGLPPPEQFIQVCAIGVRVLRKLTQLHSGLALFTLNGFKPILELTQPGEELLCLFRREFHFGRELPDYYSLNAFPIAVLALALLAEAYSADHQHRKKRRSQQPFRRTRWSQGY